MLQPEFSPEESDYLNHRELASKESDADALARYKATFNYPEQADPTPTPDMLRTGDVQDQGGSKPVNSEVSKVLQGAGVDLAENVGNSVIAMADVAENLAAEVGLGDGKFIDDKSYFTFSDKYGAAPDTKVGQFAKAAIQWAVPFGAMSKVGKMSKVYRTMPKIAQAMTAGAAADFIAFDPRDERMSNALKEMPVLGPILFEYLAAEADDSQALGRFKQMVEGVVFGGMVEMGSRAAIAAKNSIIETGKAYRAKKLLERAAETPKALEAPKGTVETPGVVPDEAPQPDAPARPVDGAVVPTEPQKPLAPVADPLKKATAEMNAVAAYAKEMGIPMAEAEKRLFVMDEVVEDLGKIDGKEVLSVENGVTKINLAGMDERTNLKGLMRQLSKTRPTTLEQAKRGVISDKAAEAIGRMTGLSVEDVKTRIIGTVFNVEDTYLAEEILEGALQDMGSKLAKLGKPTTTQLDVVAAVQAKEHANALFMQLEGSGSEAARTLRAHGVIKKRLNADSHTRMLKMIVGQSGADIEAFGMKYQQLVAALGEKKAALELGKAVRQSRFANLGEIGMTWYTNALLSNPGVLLTNLLSNATTHAIVPFERGVGRANTIRRELFNPELPMTGDGVAPGEMGAHLLQLFPGLWDATKVAASTFKSGRPSDWVSKFDGAGRQAVTESMQNSVTGRALEFLGTLFHRGIMSVDEFSKSLHARKEGYALAYNDGWKKGLKGKELADHVTKTMNNMPDDMQFRALEFAREQTFQGELNGMFKSLHETINSPWLAGTRPGRVILPFVKTPLAIGAYTWERFPALQLTNRQLWSDLKAGGRRQDLALGKIALGTTMGGVGASLVAMGVVTGGGPKDPAARKMWESVGWKPYSIKIGNEYYSYAKLDPLGGHLAAIADLAEIGGQLFDDREDDGVSAAFMIGGRMAYAITPKLLTESFAEILDAVNDPERNGKKFITRMATGAIPYSGLIRYARKQDDPLKRDTNIDPTDGNKSDDFVDTFINELRNQTPSWGPGEGSKGLKPQLNLFGQPVAYDPGHSSETASPLVGYDKDSPIRREIIKLQLAGPFTKYETRPGESALLIQMPARNPDLAGIRVPLSPNEYHDYVKLSAGIGLSKSFKGMTLEEFLNDQVKNKYPMLAPQFRDNVEMQRQFIAQAVRMYRSAAGADLIKSNDAVKQRVKDWAERARMLQTDADEAAKGLVNHGLGPIRSPQSSRAYPTL